MVPGSTTWTNVIADGAALNLGFGGLSHVSSGSICGVSSAPTSISASANNHTTNPMWIKSVHFAAAGYKDFSSFVAQNANTWYAMTSSALKVHSLEKYKIGPWFAWLEVNLGKNGYFANGGRMS